MHHGVGYAENNAAVSGGPNSRLSTRRRNPMACLFCRKRKIKCEFNKEQDVCDHCRLKSTKCTVLSVAQEETFKALGYTDESLAFMSSAELDLLQRRFPSQPPSSAEHIEVHPPARLHHNPGPPSSPELESRQRRFPSQPHSSARHTEAPPPHHNPGPPSSPHHPLPSTGQDSSENFYRTYDADIRAAPSSYNNSAHIHHTASRTGSTNPGVVSISTPHPRVHAHHQSCMYSNYPNYMSPLPNHQMSYQIPATGGASVPHHTMGDHQQVQQLHPNIPTHSNAVQSQVHANYPGQGDCPFQTAQQPSQGQRTQHQFGGYGPATMAPDSYTTHDGSWGR